MTEKYNLENIGRTMNFAISDAFDSAHNYFFYRFEESLLEARRNLANYEALREFIVELGIENVSNKDKMERCYKSTCSLLERVENGEGKPSLMTAGITL